MGFGEPNYDQASHDREHAEAMRYKERAELAERNLHAIYEALKMTGCLTHGDACRCSLCIVRTAYYTNYEHNTPRFGV